MPRLVAPALAALAAALHCDERRHIPVHEQLGNCGSVAGLVRACSMPARALAVFHRHMDVDVRLSATSTSKATFQFAPDVDFVGQIYLLVRTPVLVNQCSLPTTETGAPGTARLRYIIPADADRPGSFAGPLLAGAVIKEGVSGCQVHVDFGPEGRRFSEGGPPLDRNAAGDLAAYYTEYAGARFVSSARLVADGHEISALTCDAIAALCETVRAWHSPSARTGGCGEGSRAGGRGGLAFAHLGEDAAVAADLKVRSLQEQTWTVPLPFFPHGEAFPHALLRRRSVRDPGGGATPPVLKTPLCLELVFSPLYELVCNGSDTLPSTADMTTHEGQAPVRTGTFPPGVVANTSAFAHHALRPSTGPGHVHSFEPAHFRVQLVVEEFLVDSESLQDMYAGSYRAVPCVRVRPLAAVTVDDPQDPVANLSLAPVKGGLESLVWFPRLQMDTYRHLWYRMRGMPDQVTGRATCALASSSVTVRDHTYRPACAAPPTSRSTDKEIYTCDFGTAGGTALWRHQGREDAQGQEHQEQLAAQDAIHCRVSLNVFADNSATEGVDATNGCGGPPAVTVLAFALERQVLEFRDRVLVRIL